MEYARIARVPELRNPALIVAFTGWGDAGSAASAAALLLLRGGRLTRLAELDAEAFYVMTAARPIVRQTAEGRLVQWPSLAFLMGGHTSQQRDLVVLVAAEPHLRWRSFSQAVAETWEALGGGPAVLLGTFLAKVLHVGPVPLVGSGSKPHLGLQLRLLGVAPNNAVGPTTAIMPVYEALASRGVDCVNLWAAVPHYLYRLPNPKVTTALVRVVSRLLDLSLDISDLEQAAAAFEARLNSRFILPGEPTPGGELALHSPPDLGPESTPPLPTGQEAIREVERLLGLGPQDQNPEGQPQG